MVTALVTIIGFGVSMGRIVWEVARVQFLLKVYCAVSIAQGRRL